MGMSKLVCVQNLSVGIERPDSDLALTDSVSFDVHEGEMLGLVGESGCGKTVTALALLGLLPDGGGKLLSGSVKWGNKSIHDLDSESLRKMRGQAMSMIFQEPSSAMNPLYTVAYQLEECFKLHKLKVDQVRIRELLSQVGFPDPSRVLNSYPHELSGGQLQRVMISMALMLKPKLIIADEPTTALDVTVQAQIMELLDELRKDSGTAVLLITHNLGLVAQYADRVGVMYAGRLVEEANVESFFKEPKHPYSKGLLNALPKLGLSHAKLEPIAGSVPLPKDYPTGCRFMERCDLASSKCKQAPPLEDKGTCRVACFEVAKA